MADLLIRAGMNDHVVIGDVLAPGGGFRLRPSKSAISQLVSDAHVAPARPVLAEHARAAGIPYLIDPDTPLMQCHVDPKDRWARLPFGQPQAVRPAEVDMHDLVSSVVDFQLDHGGTIIVPPYFYASSASDPWFQLNIASLAITRRYLERGGINLPVLPVFCAQLQSFAPHSAWADGLDRFLAGADGAGIESIALCLSPAGSGSDGFGKVMRLFQAAIHAKSRGFRIIAWRQGVYGPALVAAGMDGYETGIGIGEQTDIAGLQARRRTRSTKKRGGGGPGIFLEPLGRSVPRRTGQILLGDIRMRPRVLCDDEGCCDSVAATLDQSRHHAIRTRARMLSELVDQPHARWRLNHIARQASAAATLAGLANRVLSDENERIRIGERSLQSLARVAGHLAEHSDDLTA